MVPQVKAWGWYTGYGNMTNFLKTFARDESGASAAEYALLLVVIGIAIILAAGALSGAISKAMNDTATTINNRGAASA